MEELSKQIPTIIFGAKDGSGADLSAVRVTMDGEVLAERLEGTALSIDPGEHTFTFESPGQPPTTKTLVIEQAQKDRRELITIGTAVTAPLVQTPSPASALQPPPPPPQVHRRTWPWWVGGAGVALAGTGIILGAVAANNQNQVNADSVCQSKPVSCSGAVSNDNVEEAIAIALGGVGAVGIGVAIWGLATRPSSGTATAATWKISPLFGAETAGLRMKGVF